MTASAPPITQIVDDLKALIRTLDDLHASEPPEVQRVLTDALCHLQLGLDTIREG